MNYIKHVVFKELKYLQELKEIQNTSNFNNGFNEDLNDKFDENLEFQSESSEKYKDAINRIKKQPISITEKALYINVLATTTILYESALLKIPETLIKKWESMAKKVLKKEENLAKGFVGLGLGLGPPILLLCF
jgi:hypothetical protein